MKFQISNITVICLKLASISIVLFALMLDQAKAETVKIGFLAGYTGPISEKVANLEKAARLAIDHVNENGGLSNGQKLELVVADSACVDADAAISAARQLVEGRKVSVIVGGFCSIATANAAKKLTVSAGVPLITPASTSPAISSLRDKDLVFRTSPSDSDQYRVLARRIFDNGVKTIAITYIDDAFGVFSAGALEAEFLKLGGSVAIKTKHGIEKNYTRHLKTIVGSAAQHLVIIDYADQAGPILLENASATKAIKGIYSGNKLASEEQIAAFASNLNGKLLFVLRSKQSEFRLKPLGEAAGDKSADIRAPFFASTYDAVFLAALAVEKAISNSTKLSNIDIRSSATSPGSIILANGWATAKAFISSGKELNYQGISGNLEFDNNGDVSGVYDIITIQNDRLVKSKG